jgi:hypothetical protein
LISIDRDKVGPARDVKRKDGFCVRF